MIFTQKTDKYVSEQVCMVQVFLQFYIHERLKKFGAVGDQAALNELKQLYW